jgi:hypothetical protein
MAFTLFKNKKQDDSLPAGNPEKAHESAQKKSAGQPRPVTKPQKNNSAERKLGDAFVPASFIPPANTNQKIHSATAQPAGSREIAITLGDVLPQIPAQFLRPGPHDLKTPLRFDAHDLTSDIARGRATVRLARIAKLCPQIFAKEIGVADDADVPLPLQKLFEQISALRSVPMPVSRPPTSAKNDGAAAKKIAKPLHVKETEKKSAPILAAADSSKPATSTSEKTSAFRKILPFFIPPPPVFPTAQKDAAEPAKKTTEPSAETIVPVAPPIPQSSAFDQGRLQMLLITNENLDAKKVADLVAELPDVSGCLLYAGGTTYRAGHVPEALDVKFFTLRTIEWLAAMKALKLGATRAFTAHGTERAATLFASDKTGLCVFHDDYGLLPGYIEKLDAVVVEVARMVAKK